VRLDECFRMLASVLFVWRFTGIIVSSRDRSDTVEVEEVIEETRVLGAIRLQQVAEHAVKNSAKTNEGFEDWLRKGCRLPAGYAYDWDAKKFYRKKAPGRVARASKTFRAKAAGAS
jgi:hypothetical protein